MWNTSGDVVRRMGSVFARSILVVLLAARAHAQGIPARLADSTFWRMMNEYSEPWGTFRSENFVSNETSLQWVIPELQKTVAPGGVYVGVAPDQNFTYVVALRPSIAFIVDIRHQNAMQHLMYKAIFEMTSSRAEFMAMLFSRPAPPAMDTAATTLELLQALGPQHPDSALYVKNLAAIKDRLMRVHRFALNDSEQVSLDCVYGSFFSQGPGITYNYGSSCRNPGGFGGGRGANNGGGGNRGFGYMPNYLNMVAETDGTGLNRSYLGTEANFRAIKDFEERNLIVPLTGNFAGDKALKTVGAYVRDHGAKITTFYVSNVEQYLFQQGNEASRFYKNVETLPIDATSQFIRSASGGFGGGGGNMQQQSGRSFQLISSIADMLNAFNAGNLGAYYQVLQLSHQ